MNEAVRIERNTRETQIAVLIDPWGRGEPKIRTGLGFYDHMWTALAYHGGIQLEVDAHGDLEIDDHHTVEDVALTIGAAFDQWLGPRRGIRRFGHAYVPMDETLARAAVDLVARPYSVIRLGFRGFHLGQVATENLTHALQSFASSSRITLHAEVLYGDNDHHRSEAAFKAVGRALRMAVERTQREEVPSTKGAMG